MRFIWDETKNFRYDCGGPDAPVHVFHWGSWQWREYLGKPPVTAFASPPEWEDFWAGVLDVLLYDTKGSLGQVLPADAIIPWHRAGPGIVQIGLIRTVQITSGEPPPWYDARPTRLQRLLDVDPI